MFAEDRKQQLAGKLAGKLAGIYSLSLHDNICRQNATTACHLRRTTVSYAVWSWLAMQEHGHDHSCAQQPWYLAQISGNNGVNIHI